MILFFNFNSRVDLVEIQDLLVLLAPEDFQAHLDLQALMVLMELLVNKDLQDNQVDLECLDFQEKKDLLELKEKRVMLE